MEDRKDERVSLSQLLKQRVEKDKDEEDVPLIERHATWEELDRAFKRRGRPLFQNGR